MPGRDILVVIDDAALAAHLLAPAAVLARRFEGRLTGFFPTGLPAATSFGDLASGAQLVDAFMAAQREEAIKAEAAYRQELGRLQLTGDWLMREADFGESVTALGRLYDLVIVGQDNPDAESVAPRMLPEDLVQALGRPVLVIPYAGEFADFDRHVLVAWSGTREAARALYDAMFLLERADAVTVLEVDPPGSAPGQADLAAADVVAALKRRGIAAAAVQTVSDGTPVADVILSRAADLTADLVVMGAYGHSRLRELVMGGVSRSIFQQMTVPVLMSH
ncbi:MAG TPA: universal stress protein [Stellaceae bacterium]|nr:universal stress protein [Stellaceae bacterium]